MAPEMETSWWQEGQTKDAGPPAMNSGPRRSSIHWLVGHVLMPHGRSHENRTVRDHALFFGRRFLVED